MIGAVLLAQHFVNRGSPRDCIGDGLFGGLVVILVDRRVAGCLPMDEHAHTDVQVVAFGPSR